jgi:hypothetical protein
LVRKAKAPVEDDSGETHYFDDFESEATDDGDHNVHERDPSKRRRPARQRVELRNEQQHLRRQLSDWDDYDDGFQQDVDTKL